MVLLENQLTKTASIPNKFGSIVNEHFHSIYSAPSWPYLHERKHTPCIADTAQPRNETTKYWDSDEPVDTVICSEVRTYCKQNSNTKRRKYFYVTCDYCNVIISCMFRTLKLFQLGNFILAKVCRTWGSLRKLSFVSDAEVRSTTSRIISEHKPECFISSCNQHNFV